MRKAKEFEELASSIVKLCDGSVPIYFPNPGNWGDSLIRAGTIQFFLYHGIPFVAAYSKQYRRKKQFPWTTAFNQSFFKEKSRQHPVAIYGGGGAWSEKYSSGGRAFVAELSKHFARVIVLPTTYERPPVSGAVSYFTRDVNMSRRFVTEARFCHDMAFFLIPADRQPVEDVGYFLRTDRESLYRLGSIEGNCDISRLGNELSDPEQFFLELSQFRTIVTDRLHVSIAAGLLNRPTYLLPGAYFKNEAVYRSSTCVLCPSVQFVGSPDELPESIRDALS